MIEKPSRDGQQYSYHHKWQICLALHRVWELKGKQKEFYGVVYFLRRSYSVLRRFTSILIESYVSCTNIALVGDLRGCAAHVLYHVMWNKLEPTLFTAYLLVIHYGNFIVRKVNAI